MRFWDHQWKISFNPDPLKQPQELIFCTKASHPALRFKNNPAKRLNHKNILEWFSTDNEILKNMLEL